MKAKAIPALIARLRRSDSGATAIEYSLIVALVSAMVVGGVQALGSGLGARFETISAALDGPPPPPPPRLTAP